MRASCSISTDFALVVALVASAVGRHCEQSTVPAYCCSIGCDSRHNMAGNPRRRVNTCGQRGATVTEATIFANARGCSPLTTGSCSYHPTIEAKCRRLGLCPQTGCVPGIIAGQPTWPPTVPPTRPPTAPPTRPPTLPPTVDPTQDPTANPSVNPTFNPTLNPTTSPSCSGTNQQPDGVCSAVFADGVCCHPVGNYIVECAGSCCGVTCSPTQSPSTSPTQSPTTSTPTTDPTTEPTAHPTISRPTASPTVLPSKAPTTRMPSGSPTLGPTSSPTRLELLSLFNDSLQCSESLDPPHTRLCANRGRILAEAFCAHLLAPSACGGAVDPQPHHDNCIFDFCSSGAARACASYRLYEALCADKGIPMNQSVHAIVEPFTGSCFATATPTAMPTAEPTAAPSGTPATSAPTNRLTAGPTASSPTDGRGRRQPDATQFPSPGLPAVVTTTATAPMALQSTSRTATPPLTSLATTASATPPLCFNAKVSSCSSDVRAIAFCRRLKDRSGVHADCHTVVEPDLFYIECVANHCKGAAIACASIQMYEDLCANEGVSISPSDRACYGLHPES